VGHPEGTGNPHPHSVTSSVQMLCMSGRHEYVLSSAGVGPPGPHQSELSSLHMKLNGRLLELNADDSLPGLMGKVVQGGAFEAPPRTYGFVVFPDANAHACK
jgi:hypothetical protein